jgi:mRNA interferase HicA
MKQRELIRHLKTHGCRLIREGGNHTIYFNPVARKAVPVPRHKEIADGLAAKICKELEIPRPGR